MSGAFFISWPHSDLYEWSELSCRAALATSPRPPASVIAPKNPAKLQDSPVSFSEMLAFTSHSQYRLCVTILSETPRGTNRSHDLRHRVVQIYCDLHLVERPDDRDILLRPVVHGVVARSAMPPHFPERHPLPTAFLAQRRRGELHRVRGIMISLSGASS